MTSADLLWQTFTAEQLVSLLGSGRLRILHMGARSTDAAHLAHIAQALLERKQLRVLYHSRSRDETTERVLSPQRLVLYRGNWYLDAWCHLRGALRSFALDRVHPVAVLDEPAEQVDAAELDNHLASSYGIFSGKATTTAILRFSPSIARWVADEEWHPQQLGKVLPDGSYQLCVPYADNRELMMDILKYGPEVEVIEPVGLRDRIAQLAARTAALYRGQGRSGG